MSHAHDGGKEGVFINSSATVSGMPLVANELYAAGFGPIKEAFAAAHLKEKTTGAP